MANAINKKPNVFFIFFACLLRFKTLEVRLLDTHEVSQVPPGGY